MIVHKKHITTILNSAFLVLLLLFLLDGFKVLEIKNQIIKSFAYWGILGVSPFVLIWNILVIKILLQKLLSAILPILSLSIILIISPIKIIFSSKSWQTKQVMYLHKYSSSKKIEFQLQDKGALGYNKRTVEVTYFTSWFMLTSPIKKDLSKKWIKQ